MSSKTILSSDEILDEDVGVLAEMIGMGGTRAYMVYSYTLSAKQIFQAVTVTMSSTIKSFTCTFDDHHLYSNGVRRNNWWYDLIESADDNFAAMVFWDTGGGIPERDGIINIYLRDKVAFQDCAIDEIVIPKRNEPLEDNGFSFSHSELADAFRRSVIIKPPYQTTLSGRQIETPQWYITGRTSKGNIPSQSNNSGGCYIATAVYGSYDCPEVWTLRRFRDFSLAESWYGRMFIKLYYAVSPILVKWFGNTIWFKMFWKNTLNKMVENLQKRGYDDSPYKDQK